MYVYNSCHLYRPIRRAQYTWLDPFPVVLYGGMSRSVSSFFLVVSHAKCGRGRICEDGILVSERIVNFFWRDLQRSTFLATQYIVYNNTIHIELCRITVAYTACSSANLDRFVRNKNLQLSQLPLVAEP